MSRTVRALASLDARRDADTPFEPFPDLRGLEQWEIAERATANGLWRFDWVAGSRRRAESRRNLRRMLRRRLARILATVDA